VPYAKNAINLYVKIVEQNVYHVMNIFVNFAYLTALNAQEKYVQTVSQNALYVIKIIFVLIVGKSVKFVKKNIV